MNKSLKTTGCDTSHTKPVLTVPAQPEDLAARAHGPAGPHLPEPSPVSRKGELPRPSHHPRPTACRVRKRVKGGAFLRAGKALGTAVRVRTPLPSAWLAAPAPAAACESAASRRDAAGSRSAESEFQGTHGIPPRELAAELGFKPLISLSVCLCPQRCSACSPRPPPASLAPPNAPRFTSSRLLGPVAQPAIPHALARTGTPCPLLRVAGTERPESLRSGTPQEES